MEALVARILSANRKKWFRSVPVFDPHCQVSEGDLLAVERKLGIALPEELRTWLLLVGYGDIDESLSFRAEWFSLVDRGELKGHVLFAQDILGNYYAINPGDGNIHFVCRSAPEYAMIATNFKAFIRELITRNYDIEKWTDSLHSQAYTWDV